jgi:hypothetical protein
MATATPAVMLDRPFRPAQRDNEVRERANAAHLCYGYRYVERDDALTVVRSNDLAKSLHVADFETHVLARARQVAPRYAHAGTGNVPQLRQALFCAEY